MAAFEVPHLYQPMASAAGAIYIIIMAKSSIVYIKVGVKYSIPVYYFSPAITPWPGPRSPRDKSGDRATFFPRDVLRWATMSEKRLLPEGEGCLVA